MDDHFWTRERKNQLVLLMTANPRVLNDFQIARKFKRSRREIYQVFHSIRTVPISVVEEYVDEAGLKIVKYTAAYAAGLTPNATAKGREYVG